MNFLKRLFGKKEEQLKEKRDDLLARTHPEVVKYLEKEYPVACISCKEHADIIFKKYGVALEASYIRNYTRINGIKRPKEVIENIQSKAGSDCELIKKLNVSQEFVSAVLRGYPVSKLTAANFLKELNETLGTDYGHNVLFAIIRKYKLKKEHKGGNKAQVVKSNEVTEQTKKEVSSCGGTLDKIQAMRELYKVNEQCAHFIERDYPTAPIFKEEYVKRLNNTWGTTFNKCAFNYYLTLSGIKKNPDVCQKLIKDGGIIGGKKGKRKKVEVKEELSEDTSKINWTERTDLKEFIIRNVNFRDSSDIDNTRTLVKINYGLDLSREQIFSIISWSKKVILWLNDDNKTKMTAPLCAKFLDYVEEHPEVLYRSSCRSNYPFIKTSTYKGINDDLGFRMTRNTYNVVTRMLYRAGLLKWVEQDEKYIVVRTDKTSTDLQQTCNVTSKSTMLSILKSYESFIEESYPSTKMTDQEYVEFLNNKFNINITCSAFTKFVGTRHIYRDTVELSQGGMKNKIRISGMEYITLPKDTSRDMLYKLISHILISRSNIRVRTSALTWVQHGGILTPDTNFIHWDDNPYNNSIDNIIGVPLSECVSYQFKRQKLNAPKGNVELNKSIYQQVLLEREIKKEKI